MITGLRLLLGCLHGIKSLCSGGKAMTQTQTILASVDPAWDQITTEAHEAVKQQPLMGGLIHACILHHTSLEKALSYRIAAKLCSSCVRSWIRPMGITQVLLRRRAQILWRSMTGIRPAIACCSRSCISKAIRPFKPIG